MPGFRTSWVILLPLLAAVALACRPEPPAPVPARQAVATGAGWTTFRGSPRRTGRSALKGPRTAELAWVFRTRGPVYSDVAVAPDGTIYVASFDHRLYAVGPDGREIWSYDSGGKIWSTPSIGANGILYFGTDSDRLVALGPDGREHWSYATAKPDDPGQSGDPDRYNVDTSPALLDDGTAVFGCHRSLFAVRPSGFLRWQHEAGPKKLFSSPAVGAEGAIYFGDQDGSFFALSPNATRIWKIRTGGPNDGTPAVGDDGTVFFGSDDGRVRAVSRSGKLRWTADLGAPVRAPIAIGADGTIFASTYGSRPFLAALDGATGKPRWRYEVEPGEGEFYGIQSGALVDGEGYVYFGSRDRFVYCLSPVGRLVWRYETGGAVDSGPVLGPDGTMYVGSDDRRVYAFGRAPSPAAEKDGTN